MSNFFPALHCVLLHPIQLSELYTLLSENYVEDEDNMFRFDYSQEFLRYQNLTTDMTLSSVPSY